MVAPKKIVDKSDADRARIRATLLRSFLFKSGGPSQTADLVDAFREVRKVRGDQIIREGDREANEFFIIDAGECEVLKAPKRAAGAPPAEPERVATLCAGGTFGELALMCARPLRLTRAASEAAVPRAIALTLTPTLT